MSFPSGGLRPSLMSMLWFFSTAVVFAAPPIDADAPKAPEPVASTFESHVKPFLQTYCVGCHGGDEFEAGLRLDKYHSELEAGRHPIQWRRVLKQLTERSMPPKDEDTQPSADEVAVVRAWIDTTFINVDCSQRRDPGRVTIRRLNRAEYNNTIRDLMGVDFQPAASFPSDDVGYGFDNIGDVLSLSPVLMEKYLNAAETITATTLSSVLLTQPHIVRREGPQLKGTGSAKINKYEFHMITTKGTVFNEFLFPFTGEYILRTRVTADQAGDEPVKMTMHLGGKPIQLFEVKQHTESTFFETRLQVEAGEHIFAVELLNGIQDPDHPDEEHRGRNLGVHILEVEGPFGVDRDAARNRIPATRARIINCTPGPDQTPEECARSIFRSFASRAYRRPVTDEELDSLVKLMKQAMEHGESFNDAIHPGVQAVLVSPHFLYRVERDRDPHDVHEIHQIADYELASRLSYFLWSTMPDETLFDLAKQGRLAQPDVLQQQIVRMLSDSKSRALVDNFASQWLNLRNLDIAAPNQSQFTTFNDGLRSDMRRETELLFDDVMRQDRSILTFLDADFTFINSRLADHYNLAGIDGDNFRRVSLAGSHRTGVLTHASILTLTSDPNQTSPVKRGKWILENILGAAPPPPPPQVPPLKKTELANPDATLREQLQQHRSNPECAACHLEMDPFGLALENFDAVGQWRETDGDRPIESSGTLPSGELIGGATDLVEVLRSRQEEFCRHFVRSMLTYALGRGLEYYDVCAVNQITEAVRADGYRFSRVVQEVIMSDPFLMRRGDGESK